MLPEKSSSFITVLPSTISQIKTFTQMFISEMEAGYVSPTDIAIQLKAMEELIKTLRANPNIRRMIMDEIDKHPEKTFIENGATFEKSETGVKYDFTSCGSSKWDKLKAEKSELDIKIKAEETFLKSLINTETETFDSETGEQIIPPLKTSSSYVKVSLKK